MRPLPRTRKRLAAPRLDFIFGIPTPCFSFSLTPGGLLRRHLKPRLSLVCPPQLLLTTLPRAWPMEPSCAPPSSLLLPASSPSAPSSSAPAPSPPPVPPPSGPSLPRPPH